MADDCLASLKIDDVRACLRGKIARTHAASLKFHEGIRDSIIDAETAAIDFKFAEIGAVLKELARANEFSIGKFMCDLFISIALGPLLGTVVGKLVSGPLTNIVAVRTGLDELNTRFLKKVMPTVSRSVQNTETIESIVQVGVDRIYSAKYSHITTELDDVATGVVVDSFEVLFAGLGTAAGASKPGYIPATSRMTFLASSADYIPTTLEFVRLQARAYYEQQQRLNDIVRFSLEWFVENTSDRGILAKLQKSLDDFEARFTEYESEERAAKREIQNLTKMILVILYYGDPERWASDDPIIRDGDDFENANYPGTQTNIYVRPSERFFVYNTRLPDELRKILTSNILVPGRNKSFLAVATAAKQKELGRQSGRGIDVKRPFYGHAPGDKPDPLDAYVGNASSEWFTAEETAFWLFRKQMISIYGELTSKRYDNLFMTMLQRRNMLTPAVARP